MGDCCKEQSVKVQRTGLCLHIGSVQICITRFLAVLLIWASINKALAPGHSLQSVSEIASVVGIELARGEVVLIVTLLIVTEWVVGVLVALWPLAAGARVALTLLYTIFFFAVLTLAVWSPVTGCGCGFFKDQGTGAPEVIRSSAMLIFVFVQFVGLQRVARIGNGLRTHFERGF